MLSKLLRHWLYSRMIEGASDLTGVKPYYKVQYQLSMLRPRWLIMRWLRMKRDEGKCVRCGSRKDLQMHHPPGVGRNQPGIQGFIRELNGVYMLCDECHKD